MVSGVSCFQLVTAVMEIVMKTLEKTAVLAASCGEKPDLVLAGVSENYAELAEDQALLFGDHEEFKSAAETFTVADDGAQFGGVGRDGNGELERDDFAGLHFTAERRADAVEAEFARTPPIGGSETFAEDGDLDADVKTVSGIATQPLLGLRGRLGTVSQSELQFEVLARSYWASAACGCGPLVVIVLDRSGRAQRH
jgi:hypothetical protein